MSQSLRTCHSCGHQQRLEGLCFVCGDLIGFYNLSIDVHSRGYCRGCRTSGVPNGHIINKRCFVKTLLRKDWNHLQRLYMRRSWRAEVAKRWPEKLDNLVGQLDANLLDVARHSTKPRSSLKTVTDNAEWAEWASRTKIRRKLETFKKGRTESQT